MQIDPADTRNMLRSTRTPRVWLHLLNAVLSLAGGKAELLRHAERPWASATFQGSRHTIALSFRGAEAVAAGEIFITALPEHEFSLPRQIVAEATVAAADHVMIPNPELKLELEILLVADD